ncbi:MAG TPA: alpha/beta fold hydrolase [Burkholderiaceae bacterium]|nr:alpha/beta fold hydrolase [Burkholderiaceae bacterium]
MTSTTIEIPGAQAQTLHGLLDMPEGGPPLAYALFAHCFTCSKNFRTTVQLTRALTARNFAVLRFDFTGLGESEGAFADTNFTSNVQDIVAAADYLTRNFESPSLMFGHSFGGTAVLAASAKVPGLRAVATINSPFEPLHVRHLFCHRLDDIEKHGEAAVTLAGRSFTIKRQFLEDISAQKMHDLVRDLDVPLMIFHAPQDETVDVENARMIYQAARHPKSFVSVDGADHFLRNPSDARFVADMLATWSSRYVAGRNAD